MEMHAYKRFQILLTDWQEAYLRYVSKKHDYSFSEITRIFLSVGFLHFIPLLTPRFKGGITQKELAKIEKNVAKLTSTEAERYKFISTIYFEARKIVEYRLGTVKKRKKRNT